MRVLSSPRVQILVAALILAGLSCPAYAQTHDDLTLDVTDVSDPDAPIKITAGQISFKQEIYSDHVKSACAVRVELENVSWRTILTYEVSLLAMPRYGGAFSRVDRRDHFFTQNVTFVPGSQDLLEYDCSRSTAVSREGVPIKPRKSSADPKAELKVVFVEFVDGARYGTSDWSEHLSEGRATTIERMKELLEAYRTGGDSALRTTMARELARPDNPSYTQAALRILGYNMQTDGEAGLVSKINEKLRAAQEHANVM